MTYLYPLQLMKRTNRRRFELPFPLFSYLLYVLSLRHPQCCPVGPFWVKMFACCCCLDDIQWIRGSTAASTSSLPSATVSNRQGGPAALFKPVFRIQIRIQIRIKKGRLDVDQDPHGKMRIRIRTVPEGLERKKRKEKKYQFHIKIYIYSIFT